MFVMGDEVRRSQRGNNNAYCQDNDTSWLDWTLLPKHPDVHRFVKLLIERRVIRDVEHERRRVSLTKVLRETKHALHGVELNQPDWSPLSHSFAISGELQNEAVFAHMELHSEHSIGIHFGLIDNAGESYEAPVNDLVVARQSHSIAESQFIAPHLGEVFQY